MTFRSEAFNKTILPYRAVTKMSAAVSSNNSNPPVRVVSLVNLTYIPSFLQFSCLLSPRPNSVAREHFQQFLSHFTQVVES